MMVAVTKLPAPLGGVLRTSLRPLSSQQNVDLKVDVDLDQKVAKVTKNTSRVRGKGMETINDMVPLATITVGLRGGSRAESVGQYGVSHMLRVCAGMGNLKNTHFGFTRNMNQAGASFTCTGTREAIFYTIQSRRDDVGKLIPFLSSTVRANNFRHWEVQDFAPNLKHEIEVFKRDGYARVMDLLHQAAFRTGLGRSLIAPSNMVGQLNDAMLHEYMSTILTPENLLVVGTGVDSEEVDKLANAVGAGGGSSSKSFGDKSTFLGGDMRKFGPGGSLSYVAIAGEGPALSDAKGVAAAHVLKHVLGVGPVGKWGDPTGALGKNLPSSRTTTVAATAFCYSYSDTGLVGVVGCAAHDDIEGVAKSIAKIMKSVQVGNEDLARGKAGAKASLLRGIESARSLVESMSENGLLVGSSNNMQEIINAVDQVSAADVKAAASKMAGKMAVSVVGAVYDVPFASEM